MAVENLTATRGTSTHPHSSHGLGGTVKGWSRTVEVTAAASTTSTYAFGYVPSNARILGLSKVSWDDLASAGSPTLDLGLFAVNSNITSLSTALNTGLDLATAASTASAIADIANYGKQAWELAGASSDPGGEVQVKATLSSAAANTGGTITLELLFLVP
jgi:hypothetical protein